MADNDTNPIHDLSQRVSKLELVVSTQDRNLSDLSTSLTQLTKLIEKQGEQLNRAMERSLDRIETLESHYQESRVTGAADNVKDTQLRSDMGDVKTFMKSMQDNNVVNKVNGMSEGFNRLFWLVIAAIVTGGIGFLFLALRGAL